ncbi:ATP-binding protein [Campylobacter sp. MIT 21-1685]|nr:MULTISPECIES: DUF234 domain-containing protein [unclassified Campylobacter]MCX2682265.1 ATP-binding protein [Campylobacter sp. MIT 21-1684]MCX2750546.1 ATP-binding protein [Campylobacter sp. MIT 21-1682]MCX2806906.1 ATP-binding protein [Campylobacter sp. MIT 21-1685]
MDPQKNLFENIEFVLLQNYENIKNIFEIDSHSSYALSLFAKNNRKRYSINRRIHHFKALTLLKKLLKTGIVKLEKSKEQKIIRRKGQKLKKYLRTYTIQDKIIFKDNFTRFFFRFLKPNETLIIQGKHKQLLELIKENLEHYQSFCFEQFCREFVEKYFSIKDVQSYWDKKTEIDLYYKDEKLCLIGEVKFKKKKICKNIFTLLKTKTKVLNIKPNYYIICSKNGFSKEIIKLKEPNLLLFDMNDFKQFKDL